MPNVNQIDAILPRNRILMSIFKIKGKITAESMEFANSQAAFSTYSRYDPMPG